ncbi:hypothetical protein UlMin_038601 [Ulmus minor]
MSRYRGPQFKKIRRLGALLGLTSKNPRTGNNLKNQSCRGKKSQYRIRLEEKQKLCFHYGLIKQQLLKYVLLKLLEMHLDNILFRLGMTLTIPQARQLVNHRHILVNGGIVDILSYRCKPRDIIIELPKHLTLHPFQDKGLVNQIIDSKWVALKINELLVVEYYSRWT